MSIILNPSKSLGFNRPLTRNVTCFINVTNPNAHPVYYKFKTTLPKGSTVRPNPGKVDPGQTVGVRVMLLALEEEPPLDTICRVKFLVQSILIPPEQVTVPLHELWSTLSIHSHKLKVNYLPPEGHPLDLSSHTTTVPGAISEPSSTVSPSKLEKPPEGTSNGPSTPLVQPIPVLNSDTEVAHAHKSDIVPPPESPWTPLYENPPPPYPVMPMDPSTDISSQREEAIVAPMIFHAQNYIAKRTSRKMTSCANSVSIDHTSSFLMARGTLPMETENACSSGTTISTQDSVGPRQEAVVAHVAGSGAMEDKPANSFEGVQSAPAAHTAEQPLVPMPGAASIGANSSNFWDVPPINVPLSPQMEVGCSVFVQAIPSDHRAAGKSDNSSSEEFFGYDTGIDESRLRQPSTTSVTNTLNHRQTQPAQSGIVIAPQNEAVPMRQFTSVDWQEFSLPDGNRYYVNLTPHTITDVDLRNSERLDAVTRFLDRRDIEDIPPPEWELWLRDGSEPTTAFIPHIAWIHHGSRMVLFERPGLHPGISKDVDKMESEYHYWLFMGSHPLHAPLPSESAAEAIDVLMWFYTNPLLSSHDSASPFSQEECQELMSQLRSFSHMSAHPVSLVRTRVVSSILARVVAWKQGRHRDGSTLPGPRKNNDDPSAGVPLLRTVGNSFIFSGFLNTPWDYQIKALAREVVHIALLALGLSLLRLFV